MLKNYNDYISFAVTLAIVFLSLKLFVAALFPQDTKNTRNKLLSSFINYTDNEDE